jgi:hypothetical protein
MDHEQRSQTGLQLVRLQRSETDRTPGTRPEKRRTTVPAPENIEIVDTTDIPARNACLTEGCPCKDARIVSYRRASFYATAARRAGQTADRFIPAEPGWRVPAAGAAGLDVQLPLPDDVEAPAQLAEQVQRSTATLTDRNDR